MYNVNRLTRIHNELSLNERDIVTELKQMVENVRIEMMVDIEI